MKNFKFNFKLTVLLLALVASVGQTRADRFNGGQMYFYNKGGWTDSYKYLVIGKNTSAHSSVYSMSVVDNTQLWTVALPTSGWNDCEYVAAVGTSSSWSDGSWGTSNLSKATHYTNYWSWSWGSFDSGNTYILTPANGNNNASVSMAYIGSGYSSMNKTITLKAKVSSAGGAYTEGASKGAISASAKTFSNLTECNDDSEGSLSSGGTSGSISIGYTALLTLSVSSIADGFEFIGWYDNDGNELSTATTYDELRPTTDATIYAYFAQTYTVNIAANSHATISPNGNQTVGQNALSVSATDIEDGYFFNGWTAGGGANLSTTTATTTSLTASAAGTLSADIIPEWTIKGSGTEMGSWETYNPLTYDEPYMYSATLTLAANTTYEFLIIQRSIGGGETLYGDKNFAYVGQTDAHTLSTGANNNCHIASAGGGTYTFTWNSSTKKLTIDYPTETHPNDHYVYFKKPSSWGSTIYGHIYSGGTPIVAWENKPVLSSCNFDDSPYYYAALGNNSSIIFTDGTNQTDGLTTASSNKGKYFDQDNPSWKSFTATLSLNHQDATNTPAPNSITVTYKANTNLTGDVITTAPQKTNYTFKGYWTAQGGGGSKLIDESTENVIASVASHTDASKNWIKGPNPSSATIYAKWTRSVTLNQNSATSSGSTSVTATYNSSSLPAISSPSKDGYTFGGWYTADDGSGDIIINTSGALQASKTGWTDANSKFTRTADGATLYAKWTQNITLDYNSSYHGTGTNKTATVVLNATAVSSITHTTAATGYHLVGYYTAATSGTKILNADGTFVGDVTNYISSGKWVKADATTLYAHYEANTYTIKFDPNDANYVGTAAGSTADKAATYDADVTLTTNGFSRDGYTFSGWATTAEGSKDYDDGETLVTPNLTSENDGEVTLYAKWTPLTYTVTLDYASNGGTACSPSTITVTMGDEYGNGTYGGGTSLGGSLPTPTAPSGYVFAGWYTLADGGSKVENDTPVTTASAHTIYAHYTEVSYVYFDNSVLNWGEVWVTYDATWDDTQGAGCKNKTYHRMTEIGTTKIYRDEIPADVISSWKYNIAFNDMDKTGYYSFETGKAVFRRDFDSYATMFVPHTTVDYNKGADYYSTDQYVDHQDGDDKKPIIDYRYKSGYWMKYNPYLYGESGYVLKGKWDNETCDFYFRRENGGNSYTVTKYLPANTDYQFRIYKHCRTSDTYSSWFINSNSNTITGSVSNYDIKASNIDKGHTDWYDKLHTGIAGDYTFTLTCGTDGVLYLSIKYPEYTADAKGDWYRLVYKWNDGSAHSRVCETFQRLDNGGTEWITAFIHKSDAVSSRSMELQKYSSSTWSKIQDVDLPSITSNGVYIFKVTRASGQEAVGSYFEPYTGDFYLRSDVTAGGWDYYKSIAFGGSQVMTYSDYSTRLTTDPYSHYYCIYVDNATENVAFTVATIHTPSICDTLVRDDIIGDADIAATKYKHLPSGNPANIRFMYNSNTNTVKRAYLKAATGAGRTRFLVLHGNAKVYNDDATGTEVRPDTLGLNADEFIFVDKGNWIYELSLKASPVAKAKIIAQYNGSDRYLLGGSGDTDADWSIILGGDESATKYELAGTYDFKNNRLMVAWTPDGTDITANISDIDMLWVRHADDPATQITFNEGSLTNISSIGAIRFDWDDLIGKVGSWTNDKRKYLKYFISFPFDVNVSDVFGLNKAIYGREYIIQRYNGAKRAKDGLYLGDGVSFWEDMELGDVMHAHEGYCVIMDNEYLNNSAYPIWENKSAHSHIYLYFPATTNADITNESNKTTTVKPHLSERNVPYKVDDVDYNMQETDSHWNLIGGPYFSNAVISSSAQIGGSALSAYYRWHYDNTWKPWLLSGDKGDDYAGVSNVFNAMSCFMVQWHGTITWNQTASNGPATPASAPLRTNEQLKNNVIHLQLIRYEEEVDRAFVEMKEGAHADFVLCEDMNKIINKNKPNLFVLSGIYAAAYSQVPVEAQTIPVGVIIRQNGIYTFSMPSNFSGTAILVDTYTNTRTNLTLGDYEIYLEPGTIKERFYLEINPSDAPTAIDGVSDEGSLKDGKAHKFLQGGQMYILKDGVIYDARGARVQ